MDRPESSRLERYDLEPEPEPTVADVIKGITDALEAAEAAAELAESESTRAAVQAVLTRLILTRLKTAVGGHIDAGELLASLRRLVAAWRSP